MLSACSPPNMDKSDIQNLLSEYHDREITVLDFQRVLMASQYNIKAHPTDDPTIVFDAYVQQDGQQITSQLPYQEWLRGMKAEISEVLGDTPHELQCLVDTGHEVDPRSYPSYDRIGEAYQGDVELECFLYLFQPFRANANKSLQIIQKILLHYQDASIDRLYLNISILDSDKIQKLDKPTYGFNAPEEGDVEENWATYCLEKLILVYKPSAEVPSVDKLYSWVSMDPNTYEAQLIK